MTVRNEPIALAVNAGRDGSPTPVDILASDINGQLVAAPPPELALPAAIEANWLRDPRTARLQSGWQIGAAIVGWPLWWALGLTLFVLPLLAISLGLALWRRRPVQVPPGFWLWGLFLVLVSVSGLAIDVVAAGTLAGSGFGRYASFALRLLDYVAVTVVLLYIGNATENELSRQRVIGWGAWLGVSTVALGSLAVALPHFGFRTPLSYLAPSSVLGSGTAKLAQVQAVLGEASPRPSAPFAFTNTWGNTLSLLLVWLVVAWIVLGSRKQRAASWVLLAVAVVPVVYSLNRGMWIGLGVSVLVVALRLASRGRALVLVTMAAVLSVAALIFVLSPLQSIVQARLNAGHSNEIRTSLASDSVGAALSSPLIGFGSTRKTQASDGSIAIGPSTSCPLCGHRDIGSTGQLWLLLVAQGFLGAALYFGYFLRTLWAFRRDHSILGIAGTLVVLLEIFYGLFYTALTTPLLITMVSIGLLWRNAQARKEAAVR